MIASSRAVTSYPSLRCCFLLCSKTFSFRFWLTASYADWQLSSIRFCWCYPSAVVIAQLFDWPIHYWKLWHVAYSSPPFVSWRWVGCHCLSAYSKWKVWPDRSGVAFYRGGIWGYLMISSIRLPSPLQEMYGVKAYEFSK